MSFKSNLDSHIKTVYSGFGGAVIAPVLEFSKSWVEIFKQNRRNAVLIVLGLILLFAFSCFLSFKILIEPYYGNTTIESVPYSSNISSNYRSIGGISVDQDNADQGKRRAVDTYLTTYSSIFEYVGDFFNDYVGVTVDPSGHSKYAGGSVEFIPTVSPSDKLTFSTENFLYSTARYSGILLAIVAPVLVLLVVITGIQILMNQSNHNLFAQLTSKMTRLVMSGAMIFIITPLLLTSSVMVTNLLNGTILSTGAKACGWESNQTDLKCFFKETVDSIKLSQGGGQQVDIAGWDIVGWAKVQTNNFTGFFAIIPLVIITLIMVILLFVVLIQFVVRYLQLYFLFIIYPIVSVFWFSKDTTRYYGEYWKQIITLLLQQPVFLLCFVIFADMSTALIADITKPANLLIFTIFLGFLATVPATLTARIFGDVWAMGENLSNSSNQNFIANTIKSAPSAIGAYAMNRFKGGNKLGANSGSVPQSTSSSSNEYSNVRLDPSSSTSSQRAASSQPNTPASNSIASTNTASNQPQISDSGNNKDKSQSWYQNRKVDQQKRNIV
jgi:fumarate reductase subunit D